MNNLLLKYCKIRKQQLLLFLFGIFFIPSIAQKEITISDFIIGTKHMEQVQFDSIQDVLLKKYNYNLPFINGLELRSESNELLLRKQEYSIRLKTNSIREIQANKKVYQSKIRESEIQGQIRFNQELEHRYNTLIDYIFNKKLVAAYKERKIQLDDRLTILQYTVYDEGFDVKEVIDTEAALFDTEVTLSQLKELQIYQNEMLQLMVGKDYTILLNSKDLITPTQIIASYTKISSNEDLEIQLQQMELETLESKMKLNVAKSKKIIDFVQAKYSGSDDVFVNENFSLGIGVNLPFFDNTREKRSSYYFNKLSAESDLFALQKNQKEKVKEAHEDLKRTISKYTIFQKQQSNSSISSLLSTYKKIEGVNPLTLVLLKISEHNKEIELLNLEYELYENYIEMLVSKNVLFQTPIRNYLVDPFKNK